MFFQNNIWLKKNVFWKENSFDLYLSCNNSADKVSNKKPFS